MSFVLEINEQDEIIGSQEKLYAHQYGILHRAFSIFIFNNKGELLLQQRANGKYHSGGLWTNTCCSHPTGTDNKTDAHNRLIEEMGFDCNLYFIDKFRYTASLNNGLIENELDYIYSGIYDGPVHFNRNEVQAIRYISLTDLKKELMQQTGNYTSWLKLILEDDKISKVLAATSYD